MDPQKFANIFTKRDFRKEIINELKKEMEEYPFFSPVIIAYLLTLRLNDDPSFRNELIKYSHYISNHRRFIRLLFEIELIKEKIKYKLTPEESQKLEQEIYERSKQKHESIIHEIIEPKIEMLKKLAQLSNRNNDTEGATQHSSSPAEEKEKTTENNITTEEDQIKHKNQKNIDLKVTITPSAQEPKEKEIQPTITETKDETIKQPTNEEKTATKKKEENVEEDKVVTIDDIFNKIAELKKQKLSAKEDFKQRITTIDKLMDEQKSREEITHEVKNPPIIDEKKVFSDKSTERKEEQESNIIEMEKTEEKNQETITLESQTEKKPILEPEQQKQESSITQSEKIEQKEEYKTTERPTKEKQKADSNKEMPEEDELIELDLMPEEKIQESKQKEITKETSIEETQKEKTIEEKQKEQPADSTIKDSPITSTTNKKSAADRILEEVRRRRQEKQQQQQLIDKFLQEKPSIDRKKEPSITGDLSEKATKEPDLVTEKMARIYELQELYDKAIETYEKLILKFPEKSDYFAKKVLELKQKLNK